MRAVVEVDITSPSLDKLPIYARLDVPEVWRYSGGRLTIFKLANGASAGEEPRYAAAPESGFLPGATGDGLTRFIAEGLSLDRRLWRRRRSLRLDAVPEIRGVAVRLE